MVSYKRRHFLLKGERYEIDGRYSRLDIKSNYEFDVDIQKEKDNIIFKRILNYRISENSIVLTSKANKSEENMGFSYSSFSSLINRGMNFGEVEQLSGSPMEKSRDYLDREVWFYQSDKLGYFNSVYFSEGRVSEVMNESKQFTRSTEGKIEKAQAISNTSKLSKEHKNKFTELFSRIEVRIIIFSLCIVLVFILVKLFIKRYSI